MIPIFKNLRSTTLFRAFITQSFVNALLATSIVSIRTYLDHIYIHDTDKSKHNIIPIIVPALYEMYFTFITTLIASFLVYNILYIVFDYGGSMLSPNGKLIYF